MTCIDAMQKYDQDRIGPSPYKFLQVSVKNHLYNMRRGAFVPNNPPCVRCEYWDRVNKRCVIDEEGCDKIVRYRKGMSVRAALRKPATLEGEITDYRRGLDVEAFILDESIRTILPSSLIPAYERMIGGDAVSVNPRMKSRIRKAVRELISDG
jgi:hypothetical protein